MEKKMVVGPDQMPDWLEKRRSIMGELDKQLIRGLREPGKGLTLEQLQVVVEHRNPFKHGDTRFELVKTLAIVVPDDYVHETRLASFAEAHRREFYYYDDNITDKNFSKATTQLKPGQRLKVDVFQIKEMVSSEDCLAFLHNQKALLVGAQGASLVHEQKHDELPKDKWYISFDEKENLWQDADGRRRVPNISADSDGDFDFGLGDFELPWDVNFCLLSFRDAE